MPGLVVFSRRWSVGSDDLVVPAVLLFLLHMIWLVVFAVIFGMVQFDISYPCSTELRVHVIGLIVILSACIMLEGCIAWVSLRGSILEPAPRSSMQYILYSRLVVFLGELTWLILGIRWLVRFYGSCTPDTARKAVLGTTIFNSFMIFILVISLWCTFDTAGRKWVKMKRYQDSLKEKTHRSKRSGSARRNWRQRKAFRAYEESWDRRFRLLCCCVERKGRNKNSMSEIAQLFTDFFRDLDVVPSDVIAGLVLLRRYQKLRQKHTVQQGSNDIYRYLSGIPVTPRTEFVQLSQPDVLYQYQLVVHYMRFAMAAYGWPIFIMMHTATGFCKLMPHLSCCCCRPCCSHPSEDVDFKLNDNCCQCNLAALRNISGLCDTDLVYVTYHVDIGETPFFVALDNKYKKIVICVRGTLSLQDVLTDLKADAETLPLDPVREDWLGHKGMVQAAVYIKKKLKDDLILAKAFEKCKDRSPERYELVLVGHSLGAGTAAILAILLQQEHQDLTCYAYSPPGGLLSYECMEATKPFITSVVVGKDVVPRLGLPQMELLRTDLINIIKNSTNPKWKIILKALCCGSQSSSHVAYEEHKADVERNVTAHPSDDMIGLTAHKLMFPPGKIILVVRNHPLGKRPCCGAEEPVYQAIWAENSDFQEVLVSPTMVNDHMPDNVMEALEKVLVNVAPPKPTRLLTETERRVLLSQQDTCPGTPDSPSSPQYPQYPQYHITENLLQTLPVDDIDPVVIANPDVSIMCDNNNALGSANVSGIHGWDIVSDDMMMSMDRDHLFPGLGALPQLELDLGTGWIIQAPLASPELLSAASSVYTLNRTVSNPLDRDDSRSSAVCNRLKTIQQSPDMQVKAESPCESLDNICDLPAEDVGPHTVSVTAQYRDNTDTAGTRSPVHGTMNVGYVPDSTEHLANMKDTSLTGDGINSKHSNGINLPETEEPLQPLLVLIPDDRTNPTVCNSVDIHDNRTAFQDQHGGGLLATCGTPQFGQGGFHCSKSSSKFPTAPSPTNKRLQYSQSESYIQTLSDKYKMKRSAEQRDIAHLRDTTKVFVGATVKYQMLQPTESAPVFEAKNLPKLERQFDIMEQECEDLLAESSVNAGTKHEVIGSEMSGVVSGTPHVQSDHAYETEGLVSETPAKVVPNTLCHSAGVSCSNGDSIRCSSTSSQSGDRDYGMEETDV